MKVLFQSRVNLFSQYGGDTTQLMKTAECVRRLGHDVSISEEISPSLDGIDIVHAFNLMRPQDIFPAVDSASRKGIPIALSTIYGRYTEFDISRGGLRGLLARAVPYGTLEYGKVLARACKYGELTNGTIPVLLRGFEGVQRRICSKVDAFLPNSKGEMGRVIEDYRPERDRHFVVPNAVDLGLYDYEGTRLDPAFAEKYGGCLLSVARIEGRKCQLELIEALKGTGVRLVIIGKPSKNSEGYYRRCRVSATENVEFIGHLDQKELPRYYKAAKAHALVSWMETPGLSSLEAAAMRCNIVATKKGDVEEYLGDEAYYCDPSDLRSIRSAVERAMSAEVGERLHGKVVADYTWERAAELTVRAYESIAR
jgi:glycosyltransferase involved in cell wall biosynthesis